MSPLTLVLCVCKPSTAWMKSTLLSAWDVTMCTELCTHMCLQGWTWENTPRAASSQLETLGALSVQVFSPSREFALLCSEVPGVWILALQAHFLCSPGGLSPTYFCSQPNLGYELFSATLHVTGMFLCHVLFCLSLQMWVNSGSSVIRLQDALKCLLSWLVSFLLNSILLKFLVHRQKAVRSITHMIAKQVSDGVFVLFLKPCEPGFLPAFLLALGLLRWHQKGPFVSFYRNMGLL